MFFEWERKLSQIGWVGLADIRNLSDVFPTVTDISVTGVYSQDSFQLEFHSSALYCQSK